jgi:hypothetical protein
VHPVTADEPIHLIEIEIEGSVDQFDFDEVTQELAEQPRDHWQSAYDELELERKAGKARFAFFFHYLDVGKPLHTSFGPVALPMATPIPVHLRSIKYEAP